MYAIIKRYTPDVKEGGMSECFANLSGLSTFFKMPHKEIAKKILKDLNKEIGHSFIIKISSDIGLMKNKKVINISTYKEISKLFTGISFVNNYRHLIIRRRKLTVPFLGKVS